MDELKEYLAQKLPPYMIPSYFVKIEKIPLTVGGKTDRRALPAPGLKAAAAPTAPRDEGEKALAVIWSGVLDIPLASVGIDDNFFQSGGHSLKATALANRVYREMGLLLPVLEIFKNPTVRKLSVYLEHAGKRAPAAVDDGLVPLKKGPGNALFLVHDGTGEVGGYNEFCRSITAPFDCWGIRADDASGSLTIEELARRYIKKIKKIQPRGPYCIAGWSIGGTIAFEMVRQMEQNKEYPAFFAMMDVLPPNPRLAHGARSGGAADIEGALRHARAKYIPAGTIETPVHYFAAALSGARGIIDEQQWRRYCSTIEYYTVEGGHYSIFKPPHVFALAETFDRTAVSC